MGRLTNFARFFIPAAMLVVGLILAASCADPRTDAVTGATQSTTQENVFPHPPGWTSFKSHGRTVLDDGTERCAECHGDDFGGAWTGISCLRCHVYPHPSGFSSVTEHGITAMEEGNSSCASVCHGNDYKGGHSGVSCFQCHQTYPHPANWLDAHGEAYFEVGHEGCATLCHGEDLEGGLSGSACSDCHGDYEK